MSNKSDNHIGEERKCSCQGYNLDKLVQPNILILLARQDLHGYRLIQELEERGLLFGNKADKTGIYRTLKTLEGRGLLLSTWDVQGAGAAKKIYRITDAGRECLTNWVSTLEQYKAEIENIIEEAKQIG